MKPLPSISAKFKLSCLQKSLLLICFNFISAAHAENDAQYDESEYVFDSKMFRGSNISQQKMLKLSQNQNVLAGTYKVDVYINNRLMEKSELSFVEDGHNVTACFSPEHLKKWSIKLKNDYALENGCASLETLVGAGKLEFDSSLMRVDIHLPQTMLLQMPRGYVSPKEWQTGNSMAFVNYSANYYHNEMSGSVGNQNTDSAFISLNGGFNLGAWQFRQQSNISYQNNETDWNSIRSYLKRPIPAMHSEISLGQLNSSGQFFSGLSYNGINLASDDRMLPDSQRGYAPVIQGTANTMARVSVKQNGREIYQTTVAAGTFKISDLYPTSYNGDLEVTVLESDGQQSTFKVPFSAVPESVRDGAFKYNVDIGQTRDVGEDTYFGNITTQYGLNNAVTLNSGIRVAEDYMAGVLGTAYTNRFGAFGTDMTYSHAKLPEQNTEEGWMFGLTYSKNFTATNTNFALAGYRFSTEGYRDLSDVLNIREYYNSNNANDSNDFHPQRSRFTASINQTLGQYGSLSFSGSAQSYRDNRDDDYQLQLSYGNTFKNGTSMNFNVSRQMYSQINSNAQKDADNNDEMLYGLSLSIPMDRSKARAPTVGLNYNHSPDSQYYQANITGTLDQNNTMNYNAGISYEDNTDFTIVNGSLQKRFSAANTSLSASYSENSWQASASAQGAAVLHSGGVTFGPYLGDTFALIEAPGAQGAKVSSVYGSKINKAGYALVPSLTPYRYNSISLNPEGMSADIDLEMGEQKIVPLAGASIKVKFKTNQGQALIIQAKFADGSGLPLGADVTDAAGNIVAVVGQNSQIYLRAEQPKAILNIVWGEDPSERCTVEYDLKQANILNSIAKITQTCQAGA